MKLHVRLSALVWALAVAASPAAAQVPALVKTINLTGKGPSSPARFATVGATTFFAANDGVNGVELWKTNGTLAGTVLVKDINPGSGDSNPQSLFNASGTLYFVANDGTHGLELWKSDGTTGGTVLLKDIDSGTGGSEPGSFAELSAGVVLFAADDGLAGRELWRSDGTPVGTARLKDLDQLDPSNPQFLVNFGGTIYFAARSGDNVNGIDFGIVLWRSDGTELGTQVVQDIDLLSANDDVADLTVVGGTLFFVADDGIHGAELWKSDGTPLGTVLVKDIRADLDKSSEPANLTAVGSTLFLSARDTVNGVELWKSDGSDLGTVMVANINPSTHSNPANLTPVGSTLFFTADNGTNGIEVWKTDGTTTAIVQDIAAGAATSNPQFLVNAGGTLFFSAAGTGGVELWKSTGTGASRVADINLFGDSFPSGLTAAGSSIFFSADNGTLGAELWTSTATTATLVKDINATGDAAISGAVRMGENVFFAATDGASGVELWKSDGSLVGTVLVKDINVTPASGASSSPSNLTDVNGTLYFAANDGINGVELWKSDGTPGGTAMVENINAGAASSDPQFLVNVNGTLFFAATDGNGTELWKSDGTPAGTAMLKNINPGASSSNPQFLTNVNGILFFAADDNVAGVELWKSDGTPAGTVRVEDIFLGSNPSGPQFLANLNGTLFFSADDDVDGRELWMSTGTGASIVLDIRAGSSSSDPSSLTVIGNTLFFAANDGDGVELWKSDVAGTLTMLKRISSSTPPQFFTNVSGILYFVEANSSGTALWKSDGTPANTVELKIFNPAVSPAATGLTDVFGTLYFAADDAVNGMELWKSNGTIPGTVMAANIFTGAGSSSPAQLTAMPGGVLFTATDSVNGRQLWGIVGADVGVEQLATPNPVALDGLTNVTLTATVTNHGHVPATGVVLTETLSSVTFVSGTWTSTSPVGSGSCGGSPVTCAIGTLDPAATATVTLVVTPTAVGSFAETAAVTTATTDLNPANASTTTTLAVWPLLSIADKTILESNGTQDMAFVVTLSHSSAQTVTVSYATAPDTATAGTTGLPPTDYTTRSGILTFAPGVTSQQIVVPVVGDQTAEDPEYLFVNLSTPAFAFISDGQALGTINDDDKFRIAIDDVSILEGDLGTTNALFTVTMFGTLTSSSILIDYATANETATTADYTATNGILTFPTNPGETSTTRTVTVPIVSDVLNEDDETFQVNLSVNSGSPIQPPNVIFNDARGQGTILNNDPLPSLSISDVTIDPEKNSGTTNAVFTVTLTPPSGRQVKVDRVTANGTATTPADYTALANATLTFNPGEVSKDVTVVVKADTIDEVNETFFVNLTNPVNATIADAQGQGTIVDDDVPQISITNRTVTEGNVGTTPAEFTVSLSIPPAEQVTVNYATADGTTTSADGENQDYTPLSGTLTFAPGETSQTLSVSVLGDLLFEANETFFLNLSIASPNAAILDAQGLGTITNDDTRPTVGVTSVSAAEGDGSPASEATFNVTLSKRAYETITVNYATADATAKTPSDYTAVTGTLTFEPGSTSKPIPVSLVGDLIDEDDETFTVKLTAPVNAILDVAHDDAVATILDEDPLPLLSINDVTIDPEKNSPATTAAVFTVTLGTASGRQVKVDYATGGGTATAPADYTAIGGTLTFNLGETSKTVTVVVKGDALDELDETFLVSLTNAVGGAITDAQGLGTIVDDEIPQVTINSLAIAEGLPGATPTAVFTVSISPVPAQTVTVQYATVDGTAAGAPGPGQDYVGTSGTLTFTAGETSHTIPVTILGDDLSEAAETFFVNLANPTNAGIAVGQGQGTITNDDTLPSMVVDNATLLEKTGVSDVKATFHVTLSKVAGQAVTVNYATANGTCVSSGASSDYSPRSGTLTFPMGSITQTVDVPIVSDALVENNETFFFNLSAPIGATLGTAKGQGTVLDDDAGGKLEFAAPVFTVSEGTALAVITVKRLLSTAGTIKVDYATSDGTAVGGAATSGADYLPKAGTLTFTPKVTARTFTVPIFKDTAKELDESVILTLKNPTGGSALGTQGTAVLNIADDDASFFSFLVTKYTTAEGKPATKVVVRRTGMKSNSATVGYASTGVPPATLGSDYAAGIGGAGTLSFAPNVVTQSFDFVPIDDTEAGEAPETVILSLTNPVSFDPSVGAKIGSPATSVVTITDNEPTVQFLASAVSVKEPVTTAPATLFVRRSSGVGTTTVTYALGGTATPGPGGDYLTPSSGSGPWTLTFLPGVVQLPIVFTVLPDGQGEPSETIEATLSNPIGASLGPKTTATATILDNEPKVQFALASYTALESAGTVNLLVKRTLTAGQVTVDYAVSGGTATAVDDFTLGGTGTLTFAPGVLTMMIPVSIAPDALSEGSETVAVTLSSPANATLGTPVTTLLTINDDDAPTLFFSSPTSAASEAVRTVTLTVKRSGPITGAATVFYCVTSASAPAPCDEPGGTATDSVDFTGGSGFLSFLPGQASKIFTLSVLNDTIPEPPETVRLKLHTASGAALGTQSGTVVTIADNDSTGTFSFSAPTYSVGEAGPTVKITVKRTGGLAGGVAVHYATSNATAVAGQDYTETFGDLIFATGVPSMTFEIPISNDPEDEVDETLHLALSAVATPGQLSASIGVGAATVTIVDNDTIGAFSFATSAFSVTESGAVAIITVTRSGAASGDSGPASSVTVHYATSLGEGSSPATVDDDYSEVSDDLTFGPGVSSMTFTVPITDDTDDEPNETVALTLSLPTGGATLGAQSTATLWIVDND